MNDFLMCVRYGFCYWCGNSLGSWKLWHRCHSVIHRDWTNAELKKYGKTTNEENSNGTA